MTSEWEDERRPKMEAQKLVVEPARAVRSGSEAWALCSRSLRRKPEGRSPSLSTRSTQGRLVLPHVHEDEYSYVLEGTIGARVGDHEVVAGQGSYVIKPRGLMHSFWNAGPAPARLLEMIAPAGFEKYFVELAEAGDPNRRQELAAKYEVTYSDEWVADLTSRYNLKLLGQ
jgi:mannose-6-phosphate isomerase-like protein (cupin superfamily)